LKSQEATSKDEIAVVKERRTLMMKRTMIEIWKVED
jgi:hypothetical protein